MKIIFDYKIFYQQKIGGISNYYFNLGEELLRYNHEVKFVCPIHKNRYVGKIENKNKKAFFFNFLPSQGKKIYENINHYYWDKFIDKFKPDIVHESYYSKKNYKNKTKIVCTVYDMINEIYPTYSKNSKEITQMKLDTVNRADKIICISKKTKEDLINYFSIDENKIEVVYLASGLREKRSTINVQKRYSDHLLFVGSRRGYKNYDNFMSAYARSKTLKENFKIIFFGGEKISKLDYMIIKKNKLNPNNILFLDDKQTNLPFLYANVAALIYPSFYEGFGLPIIEAMSFSCPVISSSGGSLKEVGGDGIEYFNPSDIEDICFKLEKILSSSEILNNQIKYGIERSQKFSWEKCAKETINVYKDI